MPIYRHPNTLLPLLIGTKSTPEIEKQRVEMMVKWALGEAVPSILRITGFEEAASLLEGAPTLENAREVRRQTQAARAAARKKLFDVFDAVDAVDVFDVVDVVDVFDVVDVVDVFDVFDAFDKTPRFGGIGFSSARLRCARRSAGTASARPRMPNVGSEPFSPAIKD